MSGWKGPLHRCSFYGNKEVGQRLNADAGDGRVEAVAGCAAGVHRQPRDVGQADARIFRAAAGLARSSRTAASSAAGSAMKRGAAGRPFLCSGLSPTRPCPRRNRYALRATRCRRRFRSCRGSNDCSACVLVLREPVERDVRDDVLPIAAPDCEPVASAVSNSSSLAAGPHGLGPVADLVAEVAHLFADLVAPRPQEDACADCRSGGRRGGDRTLPGRVHPAAAVLVAALGIVVPAAGR